MVKMVKEETNSNITVEDLKLIFKRWREKPECFSLEVLGCTPWSKQLEIMNSVRDNRRTAVRSGHGVGKTHGSAEITLWFLECWPNSIVITTAPTFLQVEKILWGEIRELFTRSKIPCGGQMLQTQIKISDKHYAIGISTDEGERMQGFHSDNVLIIVDEAPGIDEEMYESIETLMTSSNCKLLLIGNPTSSSGSFYNAFKDPLFNKIHISCLESPNVVADREVIKGLVSREWVDEKKVQWGEESSLYLSRVLGEFPEEGDDVLIPLIWVERAEQLAIEPEHYEHRVLSIDVARLGSNDTVFLPRIGNKVELIDGIIPSHQGKDTTQTIGKAVEIIYKFQPDVIIVDDVGIGGAIVDFLNFRFDNVYGFNAGGSTIDDRFVNLKAEYYWKLKEKFRNGVISIPKNTRLSAELPSIKTDYTPMGKILIRDKKVTSQGKGFNSPDFSDALMMSEFGLDQIKDVESKPLKRVIYSSIGYSGIMNSSIKEYSRTGYG